MTIPNVLANRYASDEMVAIWSPVAKIVAERQLTGPRATRETGNDFGKAGVSLFEYRRWDPRCGWNKSIEIQPCAAGSKRGPRDR